MEQNEFVVLSKKRVKELNAGYGKIKQHSETWRDGYIYLLLEIKKSFENDFHEEFLTKIETIIDQNLEVFDWESK